MRQLWIIVVVALFGIALWALQADTQDKKGKEMSEQTSPDKQIVTPNEDLAGLQKIVPIVGAPQARWARVPVGRIEISIRIPGPTDLVVIAELDYGTAEAAQAALGAFEGKPGTLDLAEEPVRYNWLSQSVLDAADDGKLAVEEFGRLETFGDAEIRQVRGVPQVLLLHKMLL